MGRLFGPRSFKSDANKTNVSNIETWLQTQMDGSSVTSLLSSVLSLSFSAAVSLSKYCWPFFLFFFDDDDDDEVISESTLMFMKGMICNRNLVHLCPISNASCCC